MYVKNTLFTTYESDIRALLNSFFPGEEIMYTAENADEGALFLDADEICAHARRSEVRFDDKTAVKKELYRHLSALTGRELPWGTLTGIRPVKIYEKYSDFGFSEDSLHELLRDKFLISDEKISLLKSIYETEETLLNSFDYKNGVSLYINIPFCPTRCVYCSFTAYPFDKWSDRIGAYIDCVGRELREKAASGCLKGRRIDTVYVGGGTPSVLTPELTKRLFDAAGESIDIDRAREITFEAGRPDTITAEKLRVLKECGTDRISINPQSMNQKTLDLIGRRHSVSDIYNAFGMSREAGFDNINMDIIAGLPGEDINDFKNTLEAIDRLNPESLTVHTLAVKHSSRLNIEGNAWGGMERKGLDHKGMDEVAAMVEAGAEYTSSHGLKPYYVYRQKNMAGSLENTGYAEAGKENLYNILMMEEKQTVAGIGAGASTKDVSYDAVTGEKKVSRSENVKDIGIYLEKWKARG